MLFNFDTRIYHKANLVATNEQGKLIFTKLITVMLNVGISINGTLIILSSFHGWWNSFGLVGVAEHITIFKRDPWRVNHDKNDCILAESISEIQIWIIHVLVFYYKN